MTESINTDYLKKVFTFPFQDPKWTEKFLIGSLLFLSSFLILPLFVVYGYSVELMRMAIEGKELALPEWDQWEKKFSDGIKILVVGLIYALPLILFFIVGYLLIIFGGFGTELIDFGEDSSPFWVLPSILGTFGGIALFGLGTILTLIVGVFMPAMMGHVIAKDDISAAFHFKEWWQIFKANLAGFIISYLLIFGLFTALYVITQILSITVIFCCLLPFLYIPITFYIMVTTSVLFGQAYREGVQNLQL